ncbi:MAG: hypothetical protein ACK4XJ_08240 [Fimbriimonadaceae bacterium]
MSRTPKPPAWWKNTYFLFGAVLFVIGVIGLPFVAGPDAIRDPGQKPEAQLALIYFGAAIVMIVNGLISHAQTVEQYHESQE